MPIDISMLRDEIMRIELRGRIDYDSVSSSLRRVWDDPRLEDGTPQLADFREVTEIDLSSDELQRIVEEAIRAAQSVALGPVAIVAPMDLAFGILRRYEKLVAGLAQDIRIFREYDEALGWLEARRGK